MRRCGHHDVGDSVAVDIADFSGDPSELIAGRLAPPLVKDLHGLDKGVLEFLWTGQKSCEARIRAKCCKVLLLGDLRHIVAATRPRSLEPFECVVCVMLARIGDPQTV